jgi:hypothetical protein
MAKQIAEVDPDVNGIIGEVVKKCITFDSPRVETCEHGSRFVVKFDVDMEKLNAMLVSRMVEIAKESAR